MTRPAIPDGDLYAHAGSVPLLWLPTPTAQQASAFDHEMPGRTHSALNQNVLVHAQLDQGHPLTRGRLVA